MAETKHDIIAALQGRIKALDDEIAQDQERVAAKIEDRKRCERALQALDQDQHFQRHRQRDATNPMHQALRKRYSESTQKRRSPSPRVQRFLDACHESKYVSMNAVASELGINVGYLSQMLRGKRISRKIAERIAKMINYPANADNWPNLGD